MIAITARSLWARKRRLVATLLAVGLGVAFLAGTLLLSDTLRANFDRLFTQADSGTDVVLRGATQIGSGNATRTGVDASLLPRVRTVPGVADAQPFLEGYGQLLDRDGKPIGGNGPPTQAANWVGDPALNPYRLVAGHAPRAADEVVINRGAARTGHLALGMTTTLLTPQPLRVHIVGIATFGTADGFGPGTFTGMTLPAAQLHLTGSGGPAPAQLSQILVRAAPGVPDAELAARLRPVLPAGVQAITGGQLATENLDNINSGFLGFLSTGLTAFAAIALLVAAFSIYNTFSILAAQRGRESALLRALGGTRRQLAVAGLAETLVIGVVGSVAGWAGGIGIAALLKGVFNGFGFALPAGGLVLRASSSVLAVAVGVAATVLAGVLPALRASRVPPLAALRELDAEPARVSRVRSALGFLLTAGGVAAAIAGIAGRGQGLATAGAVGLLAGFVVLGPVAVRPAAAVLGAPIAALRGVGGRLARDNALRNPRRTAATASALMVGVTVATLFTVIGASLKASATQGVDRTLAADLVVYQPGYGGSAGLAGFSPTLAAGLGRLPSVGVAAGVSRGSVLLDGQAQTVAAADPGRIGTVLNLGFARRGRPRLVRGIGGDSRRPALAGRHHGAGGVPGRCARPAAGGGHLRPSRHHRRLPVRRGRLGTARRAGARLHGADQAEAGRRARPGPRRGHRGHRRDRPAAGAGPGAVRGQRVRSGEHHPRARLRDAGAGHPHRADGRGQHAVAVHPRADPRAGAAARARPDPGAGARHGPVGVGDHRGVRHAGRGDPRHVHGLGRGPVIRPRHSGRVRGAAAAAGPVPGPGRGHRHPGRDQARPPRRPAEHDHRDHRDVSG